MNKIFTLKNFENKNLLILGDSVSAQATIGNDKVYATLLKENLKLNNVYNAAIGGTTLTYMYEGSNIDKEYHTNSVAIDGCRVVNNLAIDNKLKDFDYVIIAYGHNDQHFKVPLDENNKNANYLSDCHSFKNSFRFIINTLKKHNPNIQIILLSCTYSEYDKVDVSPYDGEVSYLDYRKAYQDIAYEYNVVCLDPWDYMKQFFDYNTNAYYYKDSVHLTKNGHLELFKFLMNN